MKKLFITSLSAMLVLASCNGNSTKGQVEDNDSTNVAEQTDSTVTDEPEQSEFSSIDHQTFNLHGVVVQVDTYLNDTKYGTQEEIGLDEFGRLSMYKIETFDGPDHIEYSYPDCESLKGAPADPKVAEEMGIDCKMVRDKQGRLLKFTQNEFEYDKQGRVCKFTEYGWESCAEYVVKEFNEHNDPVRATMTGYGEGEEWSGVVTYVYDEYDDHGNWVKRTKTTKFDNNYADDDVEVYYREIEYYR